MRFWQYIVCSEKKRNQAFLANKRSETKSFCQKAEFYSASLVTMPFLKKSNFEGEY